MTTLTIELPDELITELNNRQVSDETVHLFVLQAIKTWLHLGPEMPLVDERASSSSPTASASQFVEQLMAENPALFEQFPKWPEQDPELSQEADKLAQIARAANDPLFMADLRETMSAFAEVDTLLILSP